MANGDASGGLSGDAARPLVRVQGGNLSDATTDAEAALIESGATLYQRGPKIMRPVIETIEATAGQRANVGMLVAVEKNYLRDQMCKAADFERYDKRAKDWVSINPPIEIAETLMARSGEWKFQPIAGVISSPTLRPDGSLLSQPGYDDATRLYLIDGPLSKIRLAAKPSMEDASAAAQLLSDLLDEFPFADSVARSVAMSTLVTPVVRGGLPCAPLHATKAPQAGTGKSFLLDLSAGIAMGQPCPIMAAGKNPEEMEKRLIGALLAGQPIISIDNVEVALTGDVLCQAVERPVLTLRKLGSSDIIRIESRATLFASGNNLRFADDMTRRGLICQLDANLERPETRQFSHNPFHVILADRAKYVKACLTICRAYISAGRPGLLPRLASFEAWSDTVRSALVWLGYADPLIAMEVVKAEDPVRLGIEAVFREISTTIGIGHEHTFKTTALCQLAERRENMMFSAGPAPYTYPDLFAALQNICGERNILSSPKLGKWLQKMRSRIINGLRLESEVDSKHGNAWYLQPIDAGVNGKDVPSSTYNSVFTPLSPNIPHSEKNSEPNWIDVVYGESGE